jgi:RsiW-degrading membrane proteinase PrsW (M82 family)
MRVLAHVGAALLATGGLGLIALYLLMVFGRLGSDGDVRDGGLLAGVGFAAIAAAVLVELAVIRRRGGLLMQSIAMPPLWLSGAVLAFSVGVGGLAAWTDRVPAIEPVLAIAGVVALAAFFWRLVLRWSPSKRAPAGAMLATMAWGMVVATTTAVIMQFGFILAGIGGIAVGLNMAGIDVSGGLVDTLLSEELLESSGSELLGTATIAVFVLLVYAVAAPLTEELTKFLGVAVVMRRQVLNRYSVFIGGISAGLGFAVVETIGYALGSGQGWPLILALRVPVTLIHVTGTSLVAFGWYLQQRRGGYPLLGFFAVAVLVHAAWNGLLVSVMLASATMPQENPAPGQVLAILGALAMMLLLLGGCLTWVIANARRWGSDYVEPLSHRTLVPALAGPLAAPRADRVSPVHSPLSGEV